MNKDLAKKLRQVFTRLLAADMPQFEPQGGKGHVAQLGWRDYLWSVADDLHFFVCLCPDAAAEEFFVEGAWNIKAEYPHGLTPHDVAAKDDFFAEKAALLRKHQPRSKGKTLTWPVTDADLETAAAAAVKLLHQEFLPLFGKKAVEEGFQL